MIVRVVPPASPEGNVAAARAFVAIAIVFRKAYAPTIANFAPVGLCLRLGLDRFLSGGAQWFAFRKVDGRFLLFLFNRKIDLVIYVKVSREELLQRLGGRVFCQANQHVYHVKNRQPKVDGICDLDGSKLYQRPDDAGEAMRRRLVIYFNQAVPVLEYYSQQQKLREIDGNQNIDQVHKALMEEINVYTSSAAKS